MALAQSRSAAAPGRVPRIATLDIVRGLALCGMVAFHVAWDLNDWGWTARGPAQSGAWMAFGHAVASTFLFVSGYCLVLARPHGMRAALRRIAVLAGAAALVTAATRWLFPAEFIVFGILHCIAASNLVGLGFLRPPVWASLSAAAIAALMPRFLVPLGLDGPMWQILGLSASVGPTLDYRPVFPWLALVLLGLAAGKLAPRLPDIGSVPSASGLAWAGRHSLMIYLVHQPMLFALLWLAAHLGQHQAPAATTAFERQCRLECVNAGAAWAGCAAACGCMLRRLDAARDGLPSTAAPSHGDLQTAGEACLGALNAPR